MVQYVDLNQLAALQSGISCPPPVVYIPSMHNCPYDAYGSYTPQRKNHTLLVSTIVGLLAAGGAFYACRGKNSKALFEEVKAWGIKAYKDLEGIWDEKVASRIKTED